MTISYPRNKKISASGLSIFCVTAFLVLGLAQTHLVRAAGPEASQLSVRVGVVKGVAVPAHKAGKAKSSDTPNPFLSFLPAEATPDYEIWRERLHAQAVSRRAAKKAIAASKGISPLALVVVGETEPSGTKGANDTVATAQNVPGFGTGEGEDAEADITGELRALSVPTEFFPNAEDEGDINKSSPTGLMSDDAVFASATIGDGPFGSAPVTVIDLSEFAEDDGDIDKASDTMVMLGEQVNVDAELGNGPHGSGGTGTGDFDFYELTISDGQLVQATVTRQPGETVFDSILGLYDPAGNLLASNDDLPGTLESGIDITIFTGGPDLTVYFAVGGFSGFPTEDTFLSDPFDSATGPGAGSEGLYTFSVTLPDPKPGDFDFYSVVMAEGDLLTVEADTANHGGVLDPIVSIYDSAGNFLGFNDDDPNDFFTFDSFLEFTAPNADTFYISVGGFNPAVFPTNIFSFLSDPFDSSSGPGVGSEGDYDIIVSLNDIDLDIYSFELEAGDILGVNLMGAAASVAILAENDELLIGSSADSSGIYPFPSPLPGGGTASAAYIVSESGTYGAGVGFGEGAYTYELRVFRPPQEATGDRQIIYLDFDGESVDTSKWGGPGPADLSPLSSFLPNWGLTGADENAVIDSILGVFEQNISRDVKLNGVNRTFDIEIQNSRDHAPTFGDPNVSRVIIGGTIAESGIDTIGIAQSIDIGNYKTEEDSVVLLDLMSAPSPDPNSMNSYALAPGATIIDVISVGVGNIAAHEAGHFYANWHTDNADFDANIMDQGGNMAGTLGLGPDNIFGSADDIDVNFDLGPYAPSEFFLGVEDTRNNIAFGLTTGPDPGNLPIVTALTDVNNNGANDMVVVREGSILAEIRDGQAGALLKNITFLSDAFTAITIAALPDSDGNGTSELAVLATRNSDGRFVVEMRNVTGAELPRQVWFAANHTPITMTVIESDADNNGVVELAVLSRRNSDGRGLVEVKNAFGATNPRALWAGAGLTPSDVDVIEDADSNGVPEIVILSTRNSDGRIVAEIKNAAGATLPNAVWFMPGNTAIDLTVVADADNNGIPEVAVLSSRNSDGRIVVEVKNASGATLPNAVWFAPGHTALSVKPVNDADANTVPEIAVLSTRDSDGRVLVEVKNAAGATNPNPIWYSPGFTPRTLTIFDDADGNTIEEAAVLLIRDSDGRILVQSRNAAGNVTQTDYWFSQ